VVEAEVKLLGSDYKRIFIGGFSQGCCMALNSAILASNMIGGVIGLSGAVFHSLQKMVDEDKAEGIFAEKMENLPIFIYHGKDD
jgi:phospholipase/carboxylesterase